MSQTDQTTTTTHPRPGRREGPAAAHLVGRRLRSRRRHPPDHRRGALRGRRPPARPARARRRHRQRRHRHRRRPPVLRRHRRRLRARAPGAGPRAGRRRGLRRSRSTRATPRTCPTSDASFDAVTSTLGVMFTADQARPPPSCCACAGRAASSPWPTGRRTASSAAVQDRSAPTGRRRRAWPHPPCGAPRRTCATLFGAGIADADAPSAATFVFRYRSVDHFLDVFRTYYGPVLKAFEALDDTGREALASRPPPAAHDRDEHGHRPPRHPGRLPRGRGDPFGLISPRRAAAGDRPPPSSALPVGGADDRGARCGSCEPGAPPPQASTTGRGCAGGSSCIGAGGGFGSGVARAA